MRKFKNMTAAKKLTALAVAILIIFACINLVWAFTKGLPYYAYTSPLTKYDYGAGVEYCANVNGIGFVVKKPMYLAYGGFLKVASTTPHTVETDENGNIVSSSGLGIGIFIWPNVGGAKFGVSFIDEAKDLFVQILIDSELNYFPKDPNNKEFNSKAEELLKENYNEIKMYMDAAQSMWGLCGVKDTWTGLKALINNIYSINILIVFIIALATVFAIINFLWALCAHLRFRLYIKKLGKIIESKKTEYQRVIDGYLYRAQKSKYLRYNGVLSVCKETENNTKLSLLIYPKLMKGNRYIISIDSDDITESIPINRDIEYIPETLKARNTSPLSTIKLYEDFIDKYFTEIKAMMHKAENLWNIIL
ncbi:MAG: hypothetical protein ACOX45_02000 [Acutalibacteraceae bacterium]